MYKIIDHFLRSDISFEDIITLYCFDRRLRILIFNALEKIEIALRTKLTYEYSVETSNSHWFTNNMLYFNQSRFESLMEKIEEDVKRSDEDFIRHYYKKYDSSELPPAWMTLEARRWDCIFTNVSYKNNCHRKTVAKIQCKENLRIREAFIKEFDVRLADNYFITGERFSPKRIKLNRDLVCWETEV